MGLIAFDLNIEFNHYQGKIVISTTNEDFKDVTKTFVINEVDTPIYIDANGNAEYSGLNASDPPTKNSIKIKNKETLVADKRLIFFY